MSFVTKSQAEALGPISFAMNKEILKLIPKIANHPFYNNDANWFRVSFIFKHTQSRKRFAPSFTNFSSTKRLKVRNGMNGGDQYTLKKIIISQSTRSHFVIWENEIPDVANFNFALLGEGSQPDVTSPIMTSITEPSAGQYTAGDSLNFRLNFDEAVFVTGQPKLYLDVGFSYKETNYISGSGSQSLLFRYIVGSSDNDSEGIQIDSFNLNNGTIKDEAGNNASINVSSYVLNGITVYNDVAGPVVTGVSVVSGDFFTGDEVSLSVTFSESVQVSGSPRLALTVNGQSKYATFFNKSSDSQLVFKYTVASEDVGSMTIDSMDLNGSTISDAASNNAVTSFSPASQNLALNPDYISPVIESVTSGSQPLYTGDVLEVSATFSEPVFVTGAPYASVVIGGSTKTLAYNRTEGSKIVFSYTVTAGNFAQSSITFSEIVIPTGAAIKDSYGNNANISFPSTTLSVPVNPDYISPTVLSVGLIDPMIDGVFFTGDEINFKVQFSESVSYSGFPRLQLSINSQTKYAAIDSSSTGSSLYFKYIVTSQDIMGVDISAIDLNGGTIKDQYDNDASLQFNAPVAVRYGADGEDMIELNPDLISPTVVSVTGVEGDYVTGDSIQFTVQFSENIDATNLSNINLMLSLDSGTVSAPLSSVSGSTATFTYTVTSNDEEFQNLTISSINVGATASILDLAGNPANLSFTPVVKAITVNDVISAQVILTASQTATPTLISNVTLDPSGSSFDLAYTIKSYITSKSNLNDLTSGQGSRYATTNNTVNSIVVQSDGKVLIGGSFTSYDGTNARNRLVRLNSDGTVDTAFCANAVDGNKINGSVNSIAVQSDGKVLIGGNFTNYGGTTNRNRLVRLNSDGTVDATFCGLAVDAAKFNGSINSIAVRPSDGRIFVGGSFTNYAALSNGNYFVSISSDGSSSVVFRHNPPLSASWRGNFSAAVNSVAVQSDGKILVGGSFTGYTVSINYVTGRNYLIRLNSDTSLDTAFCTNAVDGSKFGNPVQCIAVQSDNKILVSGGFNNYAGTTGRNCLVRLNSNGTLDTAFCVNAVDGGKFNSTFMNSIAVESSGKISVSGNFTNYAGTTGRSYFVKFNSDGTLDTTFCTNAVDGAKFSNAASSVAFLSDGSTLVGGGFNTNYRYVFFANLSSTGLVSTSQFAQNATVGTSNFNANVTSIVVQSDNKMLVSGLFTGYAGTTGRNYLVRLNSDGTVDTDFCTNAVDGAKFITGVNSVAVQSDGKILVGGSFPNYAGTTGRNYLVRLNSDGTLDTAFCTNAVDGAKFSGGSVNSIAVQSDGKILVGGSFSGYAGTTGRQNLVRLNSNGTLDTAFCVNAVDGGKFGGSITVIFIQSDGKILVSGGFNSYAGTIGRNCLVRLNSDGTLDTAFCTNAVDGGKFIQVPYSINIQSDGKILVGGNFTNYGGTTDRNRLLRLNSDGTLDTAFCTNAVDGAKFSNIINSILVESDGKILVGGGFTGYGNNSQSYLIKLNSDGTVDTTLSQNSLAPIRAMCISGDKLFMTSDSATTYFRYGDNIYYRGLFILNYSQPTYSGSKTISSSNGFDLNQLGSSGFYVSLNSSGQLSYTSENYSDVNFTIARSNNG